MRKLAILPVLCLAFSFSVGCKKSVEGESKAWKRANQKVDELAVLYPTFKAALEEQRSAAKTAMDAANAISEEKEKIKKMAAANNMLTGGFVDQLGAIDATKKKLRDQIVKLAGAATDEADKASIKAATEQVERVLAEADATLARGAKTAVEANVLVKKVTGDLAAAEKTLAGVGKVAQDKQDKAAADEAAAAAAAAAKAKAAEPPPPWKCEYCGNENPPEVTTCGSCGAAKP